MIRAPMSTPGMAPMPSSKVIGDIITATPDAIPTIVQKGGQITAMAHTS